MVEESNNEIASIKEQLKQHEKRILKLEMVLTPVSNAPKKKISIKEFILSKKPKDDIEKALTIGYYLEKYDGMNSFNANDLKRGFRTAKEKYPNNVNDKVNKNVDKGYMMEVEEKKENLKAWMLTNSGEKHVEQGFKEK